eukprot:1694526-Pleurochrysis_carterae.AAC.1
MHAHGQGTTAGINVGDYTSWCGTAVLISPRPGASMAVLLSDAFKWYECCQLPARGKSTLQFRRHRSTSSAYWQLTLDMWQAAQRGIASTMRHQERQTACGNEQCASIRVTTDKGVPRSRKA